MNRFLFTAITLFLAFGAFAKEDVKLYRWVDAEGNTHYGDKVPAQYAEMDKHIVNEHGIAVETLRGKKSDEEIAEEQRLAKLEMDRELQRRADQALLATYMTIDEIEQHRDRRVELFKAQTKVTELYLQNLGRRLDNLMAEASGFSPYSAEEDAPLIDRSLQDEINSARDTIERHQANLQRFRVDEQEIRDRFETDIMRFKDLKGLDQQASANTAMPNGS